MYVYYAAGFIVGATVDYAEQLPGKCIGNVAVTIESGFMAYTSFQKYESSNQTENGWMTIAILSGAKAIYAGREADCSNFNTEAADLIAQVETNLTAIFNGQTPPAPSDSTTAQNANSGEDVSLTEMLEIASSVNNIFLLYADWKLIDEYFNSKEYFLSGYFAGHIVVGIYYEALYLAPFLDK